MPAPDEKPNIMDTPRFSQNQMNAAVAELQQEQAIVNDALMVAMWHLVELQGGRVAINTATVQDENKRYVDMQVINDDVVLTSKIEVKNAEAAATVLPIPKIPKKKG